MQVFFISAALTFTLSLSLTQSDDIYCEEPPEIQFASVSDVTDEEYAVGTTVTFACQYGYTFMGEGRTVQCIENENEDSGEWTQPKFSCSPQSCSDPGYISNGRRIGSLFTFPNFVKYECDNGYKLVGLSTRYCQPSGSWSGRLPTCEAVTCNPPEELENGRVTYNSLEYGSELNYKCNKGFHLNTDETVFCTSEGLWSETDVECIESTCAIPKKPQYGSMELSDSPGRVRAGSIAIFSCDGDRIADGPTTSKCLVNGQWTFPTPKCLEPCSIPYIPEGSVGGYVREKYSRKVVYTPLGIGVRVEENKEFILRCTNGYEAAGSPKQELQVYCSKGRWSSELHCEPAFCRQSPPAGENAEIAGYNPEHGGSASYRCLAEFRKIVNETIICDFGEWKGKSAVCRDTRCSIDALQFPGLVKWRKTSYSNRESFKIECDSRYEVSKGKRLICEDGNWGGHLPPCTPANCKDPPPQVDLARAEVRSMDHSSVVRYVCQEPYKLVGGSQVECSFGEWKGQLPRCDDGRCYLNNLAKSSHVSAETPQVTGSGYRLNVICLNGYSPRADTPLCLNGKWSKDSVSPCKEDDCSVPRLYHGEVFEEYYGDYYWSFWKVKYVRDKHQRTIPAGKIVSPGTDYLMECYRGYSFQGTVVSGRKITCIEGRWKPDPVCLVIGTRYVAPTTTQRTPAHRQTSSTAASTMPMSTTSTTETNFEEALEVKPEEELPTADSGSEEEEEEEECFCEYPIDDEKLFASVNGRRLKFGDPVKVASVIRFRCEHVGYHRFSGPVENKCESCGSWHTSVFPTCSDPKSGDAVIFLINNLNISMDGSIEAGRGKSLKLGCVGMESAVCPHWNVPTLDLIQETCERKEREHYKDVLYVSNLEIGNVDFENEGSYECAIGNNSATVVHVTVYDPNVQCPAFQEEVGITVVYELGRRMKSKAWFSCTNYAQELTGKTVLTCLKNGEWSDPQPYCQNIKCQKLNETDMLQIHYTQDREIDSLATFHCFAPAKRTGASFAKCLENGSWSDPTPTCNNPPCSVSDLFSALPPNVKPGVEDETSIIFPYNTTIRLTCGGDFILIGYPKAICSKNATWEIPNIQCSTSCPYPNKSPESKLIITPEKDSYKFRDRVTFSCPFGMDLNRESQLMMCLKHGWSETILPDCEEYEDYKTYDAEDQDQDQTDFPE